MAKALKSPLFAKLQKDSRNEQCLRAAMHCLSKVNKVEHQVWLEGKPALVTLSIVHRSC